MKKFKSVDELISQLQPDKPIYCIRKKSIQVASKFFQNKFQGKILYAVKTNPNKEVLKTIIDSGIKHFDVASIEEIKAIKKIDPNLHCSYMHTVKSRENIKDAYFNYGVKDFSLDTKEELIKILESTNNAKDLNLFVRVAVSNEHAEIDLSKKFGALTSEALGLFRLAKENSKKVGLSFHVGSQCMHPISYSKGISVIVSIIKRTKIVPDYINIGGGFPTIYPDLVPQSIESYFHAGVPNIVYPTRLITNGRIISKKLTSFDFYGPTCDSMDYMKGPFLLPNNIKENDYIELGQLGAYGLTFRTQFNGFFSDEIYEVEDNPIMSLYNQETKSQFLVA